MAKRSGWYRRMMAEKREDFADITHNAAVVAKAAARGEVPKLSDLRMVRTPIGGFRLVGESKKKRKRKRARLKKHRASSRIRLSKKATA